MLFFYGPAAFTHECKYPMQKKYQRKVWFFGLFVFLSWLNASEVETAKIPSGKARYLWQLCWNCHSGQQPWYSPSFTHPKCAQKNSYSAIRILLTFSLTLPFLSQLLAEILNDISLLIPLSPSAAHSNAMAVPSEAPDIRYRWQCGPQQDDHFWGSTCSLGDHNSMSCSCDHQISHGEGIFPPIRLGALSRPPHGLQNGAASPPGAVLALWGEPSHLCLHTATSQPAAGLSAVFWEL